MKSLNSIPITHPEKVLFPASEITKGDLVDYLKRCGELMLPFVKDRPISVVRCPQGTAKKCFFQKHFQNLNSDIDRISIREKSKSGAYAVVQHSSDLIWLAQLNVIEIHTWNCRVNNIETPDQIVFDLDPDEKVGISQIIEAGLMLYEFMRELGLYCFFKTSGGKGLHLAIPVVPDHGWAKVKNFCRDVALTLEAHDPQLFVSVSSKSARHGKIFIDYLRNDRGATCVAPYSPRARPKAPISVPVSLASVKRLSSFNETSILDSTTRIKGRLPWRNFEEYRKKIPI